jgi:hypothetical protein
MLKTSNIEASPDYLGLVQFLLEPLLDESDSLSLDCEQLNNHQNVWIRLAVTGDDKGKIFGRGMRNIEAVKTILQTAGIAAGQTVYLDLYGSQTKTTSQEIGGHSRPSGERKSPPKRGSKPKPTGKSKH